MSSLSYRMPPELATRCDPLRQRQASAHWEQRPIFRALD